MILHRGGGGGSELVHRVHSTLLPNVTNMGGHCDNG